jgi:hypothetical protein
MYDTSSARNALAVTTHDTTALAPIARALYVGTTGSVVLRAVGSSADVTFVGVPAGAIIPVYAQYVRATGTTASNIVALY